MKGNRTNTNTKKKALGCKYIQIIIRTYEDHVQGRRLLLRLGDFFFFFFFSFSSDPNGVGKHNSTKMDFL